MGKVYTNLTGRGAKKKSSSSTSTTSVPERYKKAHAAALAAEKKRGPAPPATTTAPEGFTRPKNVRPAGAVDLPEGGYGSLLPKRKKMGTGADSYGKASDAANSRDRQLKELLKQ